MASSITLSWRLLEELSLLLNPKLPVNDWRSLAGLLGYSVKDILNFDRAKNPTLAFLVDWSTRNVEENTISVLIRHLTEMNRHDAVDLLKPHEFMDSPVKSTNGTPSGENVVTHSQSLRGESAGEDDENLQTIRIKNVRSLKRLSEGQTSEPSQGATLLIAGRNDTKCAKLVTTEVKEDTPPNKRIPQDENHFNQDIGYLVQLFDQNTRKWLFDRVDDWFKNEPNSRVMVLSACAGVGKSVFAAKVCDVFATRGQLAGYHFCKFNMTDYSNPHTMLQPLASHLCENVPGFEEIFLKQMQLPHPKETVRDAFRDLNDPLHSLGEREPMLIVIDALDESETGGKSELIDLISREFTKLPKWIRVFVTSRPGLPVQKTLRHLKAVEVRVGNKDNDNDLKCFVGGFLTGISRNKSLVKRLVAKCNGSFLIAYHLKLFILEGKKRNSLNVTALASDLRVSETINDIYRRYFDHLMAELGKLAPGTSFRPILEILIAASGPLPLSFMGEVLGLPASLSLPVHELTVVIREANKSVFKLLVIYDDCVTVFHKSVFDWLKSDGCEMHVYTVNPVNGDEHLWRLCKSAIEKFESQSPDEKKTKGQDYALLHGVQHGVYRAQISWSESPEVAFSSSMCIGQVIVKNDEEEKLSGYGFALGSRPYFIVPWSVIRHVERCEDARRTIVRFPYQYGMPTCEIEINRNNVICHGHLPLDYAVLQLSVSYEFSPKRCHKHFCLDAGHASSSGVRYNFSFSDSHGATLGTWFRASPFPSDLLAWAEFRRRLLLSDVKDVPKVSCNYDDGLKVIEAGNDFLVPYIVPGVDTVVGKPVFCWCYTCGAIVGMHTCSVLVKTGNQKEKPLIRFFCPIRQIFNDIEHQKPGLTKSFF